MISLKVLAAVSAMMATNVLASTGDEIEHLLQFVKTTSCQYERNGTVHNGEEAVAHIRKKYRYFKDDIESAEDFIKYSATKSKMSGKYYQVHCDNLPALNSRDWLLKELARYRASRK